MRDQQGFALVTVLMVVAVLMILGTSILYVQALETRQTLRQEQQVQAHYLARSGLEVGHRHLKEECAEVPELGELDLDNPL
jgi:type II secretory pathway component PulK